MTYSFPKSIRTIDSNSNINTLFRLLFSISGIISIWFEIIKFHPITFNLTGTLHYTHLGVTSLATLLLIPFMNLFFSTKKISFKTILLILVVAFVTVAIMAICFYTINKYHFEKEFSKFFFTLAGIFLIYILSKFAYTHFKDRNIYNKQRRIINSNTIISRLELEKLLTSINSSYYRLEYLKLLQDNSILPKGDWSNNNIPNWKNDKSSVFLAQLEEKWLGLNT